MSTLPESALDAVHDLLLWASGPEAHELIECSGFDPDDLEIGPFVRMIEAADMWMLGKTVSTGEPWLRIADDAGAWELRVTAEELVAPPEEPLAQIASG